MKSFFLFVFCFTILSSSLWAKFFYAQGPKENRAVALTFDDGPGPWTIPIMDMLDKEGVKATFFMNGDQVAFRGKIAKSVKKRGHEIGDHTFSHINFYTYEKEFGTDSTKRKLTEEIEKSSQTIIKNTGVTPTLCRMPHGYNRPWLEELAQKFNYRFVNWTFGEDWQPIPEEKMVQDYIEAIRPGAILLFHDGGKNRKKTLEILPKVIEGAKRKGIRLVTVSELLRN